MSAYANGTIGTSAGVIKAGKTTRRGILIQNLHASNDLYLGSDASVTTSNGIKLAAGESIMLSGHSGDVYGIASGASTDVRYFETY